MTRYVDTTTTPPTITSLGDLYRKAGSIGNTSIVPAPEALALVGGAVLDETATGEVPTTEAVWNETTQTFQQVFRTRTSAETTLDAKEARRQAVAAITVTTVSGKTFDGDEESQDRMARAVVASSPGETTQWKLADDSVVVVTHEELKEALRLAGEAQTAVWMI